MTDYPHGSVKEQILRVLRPTEIYEDAELDHILDSLIEFVQRPLKETVERVRTALDEVQREMVYIPCFHSVRHEDCWVCGASHAWRVVNHSLTDQHPPKDSPPMTNEEMVEYAGRLLLTDPEFAARAYLAAQVVTADDELVYPGGAQFALLKTAAALGLLSARMDIKTGQLRDA